MSKMLTRAAINLSLGASALEALLRSKRNYTEELDRHLGMLTQRWAAKSAAGESTSELAEAIEQLNRKRLSLTNDHRRLEELLKAMRASAKECRGALKERTQHDDANAQPSGNPRSPLSSGALLIGKVADTTSAPSSEV